MGRVEPDEYFSDAPWDNCCGFEHEVHGLNYYSHPNSSQHYSYVNRSAYEGGCLFIVIDDSTVEGWNTGPSGCSKQVRFESIARAKRDATERLVKWYENGWTVWTVSATYKDYADYLGGIYDDDSGSYAEDCVLDRRLDVAEPMKSDGYIIENEPDPPNEWSQIDAFRDQIRRNLNCG